LWQAQIPPYLRS
jgi:hypothetical protein